MDSGDNVDHSGCGHNLDNVGAGWWLGMLWCSDLVMKMGGPVRPNLRIVLSFELTCVSCVLSSTLLNPFMIQVMCYFFLFLF